MDLDGAKTGKSKNRNIIKEIKKKQVDCSNSGGIRTEEDIKDLLHSGIDYIILGTMLVEKLPLIQSMMGSYGHCFIAGVDVKDGFVKTHGWLDDKGLEPIEFGKKLFDIGFKVAVYTDISKDGKMQGPNLEATKQFASQTGLRTILSGGISSHDDIEASFTLRYYDLEGVIVGKAYYEGKIDLKEMVRRCKEI